MGSEGADEHRRHRDPEAQAWQEAGQADAREDGTSALESQADGNGERGEQLAYLPKVEEWDGCRVGSRGVRAPVARAYLRGERHLVHGRYVPYVI